MIKIGIIGCGSRGTGAHINLVKNYFSDISSGPNTIFGTNCTSNIGNYAYIDKLKNDTLDTKLFYI